jgi:putative SOS response-associated peptidase YedK
MCGRFTLTASAETLAEVFGMIRFPVFSPEYNIAPTRMIWGVVFQDGQRTARQFKWGLVPFWADDPKIGVRMFNARSETAHKKPSFKNALNKRRLLIPTTGFFEWERVGSQKHPRYFQADKGQPFAIAGLWERWFDLDGTELQSTTLLTTEANDTVRPFHHRMPVILPASRWEQWLDPTLSNARLPNDLFAPAPNDVLHIHRVSQTVNNVRNQGPECIERAD